VIETLCERLFPAAGADPTLPEWFTPLVEEVGQEIERMTGRQHDQHPALEQELRDIRAKVAGWSLSLANPVLNSGIRRAIEAEWENALEREQTITVLLNQNDRQDQRLTTIFDPAQVYERLEHLDRVLARNNPTLGNLELSMHIDRIDCYDDGKVVMRTCKLGTMSGAVDFLASDAPKVAISSVPTDENIRMGTPRRRSRLRVDGLGDRGIDQTAALDTAADPQRFAGLDARWFWTDVFEIPRRKSWAEEHAAKVVEARTTGLTMEKLAEKFGKTVPTIRTALRFAASVDESVNQLPQKMPRSRWHEDHASEVAAKKAEGLGTGALATYFGKSDTTIRAALEHARKAVKAGTDASSEVVAREGANPTGDA
jgi:DNA-directed RNA polymerase specialized sigma24 family protein